jgi:hypothetical protein
VEEYGAYMHMVQQYEKKISTGDIPDWQQYADQPYGYDETVSFIKNSAAYIRKMCTEVGIPLQIQTQDKPVGTRLARA